MTKVKSAVIVDTNVAVVSNGETEQASLECQRRCISKLVECRTDHRVLLDDHGLILAEYRNNLRSSGQPGTGDAFFKWLFENQGNTQICVKVAIEFHCVRGFASFPDDPVLANFDADDRKFVAVALESGFSPPVINASDRDWWEVRDDLERWGVRVMFLCPELMES